MLPFAIVPTLKAITLVHAVCVSRPKGTRRSLWTGPYMVDEQESLVREMRNIILSRYMDNPFVTFDDVIEIAKTPFGIAGLLIYVDTSVT